MDLKDKLKNILKTRYGIENDAQLLAELEDMEEFDIGVFVAPLGEWIKKKLHRRYRMLTKEDLKKYHVAAERILNAIENSKVPVSWHEMNRCALESVVAKELILIEKETRK